MHNFVVFINKPAVRRFEGYFNFPVGAFVTFGTRFCKLNVGAPHSRYSNSLRMRDATRLPRATTISAYHIFLSVRAYSIYHMLFKYAYLIDLPSSGTSVTFSFLNPRKIGFNKSLNFSDRPYSFPSNCSPNPWKLEAQKAVNVLGLWM